MYEMFVNEGRPEREIAETLNAEGHRTDLDRPWTRATVHQVLTNEKYIGNNVFAKVSFKLKQRRVVNPREMWIRAEGAYPAIVDQRCSCAPGRSSMHAAAISPTRNCSTPCAPSSSGRACCPA